MNQKEKHSVIESLRSDFANSQAAFLVGFQGLPVSATQALRVSLRKEGGKFCVVKNTLARIAAVDKVEALQPYFKTQLAIVFAEKEASSVAKVLCAYQKEQAQFHIVVGCLDSRIIDPAMVKFLGSLPSREVVAAQLCGTIKAPISTHVSVLNQLILRLLWVVKQASQKQ